MNRITIEPVTAATDEVRGLIAELDRTLAQEYTADQQHGLPLDAIFAPHVRFFLARLDGAAVGCGGVAFFDGFGELKRMYVRDDVRGLGIARALLLQIESETSSNALEVLRLETGDRQVAAMRLYERAGFTRCGAFGEYLEMLPEAISTSVFFEKRLGAAPPGAYQRETKAATSAPKPSKDS